MLAKRPSHKELTNKIRLAKATVGERENILIVDTKKVACDALELDYLIKEELHEVLLDILDEIRPEDYTGERPPKRSYEDKILDCELFGFKFNSIRFKTCVYFKFTINQSGKFWLVSLHKDKPKRRS